VTCARPKTLVLRAKLFCGFADLSRLVILEALRDGARTVSQIVQMTLDPIECLQSSGLFARVRTCDGHTTKKVCLLCAE